MAKKRTSAAEAASLSKTDFFSTLLRSLRLRHEFEVGFEMTCFLRLGRWVSGLIQISSC